MCVRGLYVSGAWDWDWVVEAIIHIHTWSAGLRVANLANFRFGNFIWVYWMLFYASELL